MEQDPIKCVSAIAIVASLLIAGFISLPNSKGLTVDISGQLTTSSGPTALFGGGDHYFIRFGKDAAFGVVWGTSSTPNSVYIVAIKARYLGLATVRDSSGTEFNVSLPIKVYTLYAMKLEDFFEYNDTNDNGVADYMRNSSGLQYSDYVQHEPIYKRVSLSRAWTASQVTVTTATNEKQWTFTLSAADLNYSKVNETAQVPVGDDKLNNLNFTFSLTARAVEVDNATLPQYRITVTRMGSRYVVSDVERLADEIVNGKAISYGLKWSQEIVGWDYDPANQNPGLLLEFHAIMGNFVPATTMGWMEMRLLDRMTEGGSARWNDESGNEEGNATTGNYTRPRRLISPYITFEGSWSRIARMTWVSNITVDGVQDVMYAQVQGGRPFWTIGEEGRTFVGFVLLAGLSYPGGVRVVHDPSVESDALLDPTLEVAPSNDATGALMRAVLVVIVVIAVAALIGILAVILRKRRKGQTPP